MSTTIETRTNERTIEEQQREERRAKYTAVFGEERIEKYEGFYDRHRGLWGSTFREHSMESVKRFLDASYPRIRYIVTIVDETEYGTLLFRIHSSRKMRDVLRAYSDGFDDGHFRGEVGHSY